MSFVYYCLQFRVSTYCMLIWVSYITVYYLVFLPNCMVMLIWVLYIIVYYLWLIPNCMVMLIWVSYIIVYNFVFVPNCMLLRVVSELEVEESIVNWSVEICDRLGSRLYPLWNRTAGDCLLDSVLQATWGVFDSDNGLRRAMADSLSEGAMTWALRPVVWFPS